MISPETYQSSEKKTIGAVGIYQAESLEAVRKRVEEDVYYVENVVRPDLCLRPLSCADSGVCQWDREKIIILPWVPVFPPPSATPE